MRIKRIFFYFKKDKRRFPRLSVHHLLKYNILKKKEEFNYISFVRNISASGLLFYSREYIPLDSILELEISFPAYSKTINLKASVVRVNFLKKIGGFNIGVEFINPDKEIVDFINDKVLKVYKKIKEKKEGKMKLLAGIFIILAGIISIFGFVAKILRLALPIALYNWINIVIILLLFSIAISVLVIARR